jgi:hypothetical protein
MTPLSASVHCRGHASCVEVEGLLRAAPRLRVLVADINCYGSLTVDMTAAHMLRNEEGLFQPLRIRGLQYGPDRAAAGAHAMAAALAVHASPLTLLDVQETLLDVPLLDVLVDAALKNKLAGMLFFQCSLSPASMPSLVRLLGAGSALTTLCIDADGVRLLDAPAAALLGIALHTNCVLETLKLTSADIWHDGISANTLLTSLVAHPSLRSLKIRCSKVPTVHAAYACTALFSLVAANAPALQKLDLESCKLDDVCLLPLMNALPRNTHLRKLILYDNDMSEAFARDVLLPAVRANKSLTKLGIADSQYGGREAHAILSSRCAASS